MRVFAFLLAASLLAAFSQDKDKPAEPPKGSISGAVTESTRGTPMKDVEIWVARNSKDQQHTVTDQQGRYVIRDVTPGQVRLSVNAPDSSGRTGFGPSANRQINLNPGQDLTGVDFALVMHGQITGKVIDQNKEPVVGIAVYLVAREYSYGALRAFIAGVGTTDDQGEYVVERVFPDRAYAVIAQKRYRALQASSDAPIDPQLRLPAVFPTYHPNARSLDGAEMLVLRPGERREGVDIQLVRGPSFCLDALLEGGRSGGRGPSFNIAETQPHSGRSGNGGFYTSTPGGSANPDGTVRICDLHSGEYELSVSGWSSNTRDQFASTIVNVGDRDVNGVRLALRPKTPVTGEVVFDGPAPEPPLEGKLRVNVETITRTERGSEQVEIPGAFAFTGGLLLDEYGLDITGVPPGIYVKDVTYGDRSIMYESLRVGTAMGSAGLRVVLARDGGTVTSHIVDKDGNPVVDCSVVIMPAAAPSEVVFAAQLKYGKTSQSGSWTTPTLPPGKYIAFATKQPIDRSPETIGKLWKVRNRGEDVVLTKNGKLSVTLSSKTLD